MPLSQRKHPSCSRRLRLAASLQWLTLTCCLSACNCSVRVSSCASSAALVCSSLPRPSPSYSGQRPEQSGIFANSGSSSSSSSSSSSGSYPTTGSAAVGAVDNSHSGPLGSAPVVGAPGSSISAPGAGAAGVAPAPVVLDHGVSGPTTGPLSSGGGVSSGSSSYSLGGSNAYNGFSSDPLNVGNGGGPVQAGGGLLGNAGGNSCYDSKGNYLASCGGKPGEIGNPNAFTGANSNPFAPVGSGATVESNKPGPPGAAAAGPIKSGPAP